ncbi:MAG: zinc ribbon domain-containing protein [Anaerolineales bacterium]|nr:MAG: zinc ribbon domain-containing protein [Anaerolineales bacterium]
MEGILERIPALLTLMAAFFGGVTVALVAGTAVWTFRDIRARAHDVMAQILATMLVVMLPIVGLVIYVMLRPRETLAEAYERSLEQEALLQAIEEPEDCPGCGQRTRREYVYCPDCHTRLKKACPSCSRPLDLHWTLCPYCSTTVPAGVMDPLPRAAAD